MADIIVGIYLTMVGIILLATMVLALATLWEMRPTPESRAIRAEHDARLAAERQWWADARAWVEAEDAKIRAHYG